MTKSMMASLSQYGITDGMVTSLVITILLTILAVIAGRKMQTVPGRFQSVMELSIGKLYGFFEGIMGKTLCRQYFPIVATLFIYILQCYSKKLPV